MCEMNDFQDSSGAGVAQYQEDAVLEKIFSECDDAPSTGKVSVKKLIDYMRDHISTESSSEILIDLRKSMSDASFDGEVTRKQYNNVFRRWLAKIRGCQHRISADQDNNNNLQVDHGSDGFTDENPTELSVSDKTPLDRTIACDYVETINRDESPTTREWRRDCSNTEDSESESESAIRLGFHDMSSSTICNTSPRCETLDNYFGDISAVENPDCQTSDHIPAETTQALRFRIHRCSVDNNHLREELQRSDEIIGSFERQLGVAQSKLEKVNKTCEKLHEELEELKEQLGVTERDRKAFETRNHRLERENFKLKKEIAETVSEIQRLNADLDKANRRKEECNKLLANCTKELNEERTMHEEARGEILRIKAANVQLKEECQISREATEHFQTVVRELETRVVELQRNQSYISLIETSFGSDDWPKGENDNGRKSTTMIPHSLCDEMRAILSNSNSRLETEGYNDPDLVQDDDTDVTNETPECNGYCGDERDIPDQLDRTAVEPVSSSEDQEIDPGATSLLEIQRIRADVSPATTTTTTSSFTVSCKDVNTETQDCPSFLDFFNSIQTEVNSLHSKQTCLSVPSERFRSASRVSQSSGNESPPQTPIAIEESSKISLVSLCDTRNAKEVRSKSEIWRTRDPIATDESSDDGEYGMLSRGIGACDTREKTKRNTRVLVSERRRENRGFDVVERLNSDLEKLTLQTPIDAEGKMSHETETIVKVDRCPGETETPLRSLKNNIHPAVAPKLMIDKSSELKSGIENRSNTLEHMLPETPSPQPTKPTPCLPSSNREISGEFALPTDGQWRSGNREMTSGSRSVARTMSSEEDSSDSECHRDRIDAEETVQVVASSLSSLTPPQPPPPPPPPPPPYDPSALPLTLPLKRHAPITVYGESLLYNGDNADEKMSGELQEGNRYQERYKNGEKLRRSFSESDCGPRFRNAADRRCDCGWNVIRWGNERSQKGASGDQKNELNLKAFPNLPDGRLIELGLADTSDGRDLCERMNEDDLERKYTALSMGLETDRVTLPRRLALAIRHRDQAERNLAAETEKMLQDVQALAPLCMDRESVERIEQVRLRLEMISRCALRVSCTAELLGATHQERRVSRAILLADRYLQALRAKCEKLGAELAETKRILTENNIFVEENPNELVDDVVPRIRYRGVSSPSRAATTSRRRASIATITRTSTATLLEAAKDNSRQQRASNSGRITLRRPSLTYDPQRWDSDKLDRTDSSSSSIGELREIFEQAESRRGSREENNNLIRTQLSNYSIGSCDSGDSDVWTNAREESVSRQIETRQEESPERNASSFRMNQRMLRSVRDRLTRLPIFWYALFVFVFFFGFYSNRYVATRSATPLKWWSVKEMLERLVRLQHNVPPPTR